MSPATTNRFLLMEPTTHAQLYDLLHGLFGVGDWTETDERPYHKFRMVEISKIKSLCTKRRIGIDQLTVTAKYCYRRGLPIHSAYALIEHMADALRERAQTRRGELGEQMGQAALAARQAGHEEWADRLLLAQGAARQELLVEWHTYQRTLA